MDANDATFQREVIDASRQMPVLVDFWAAWCAPCRALGPLLERLELDYAGRFKLVKIESDANAETAARYQVRSIPYVMAFVDGAPVDSFVGVLPERQLREFIERVAPGPAERERRRALGLAEHGEFDAAAAALRAALELDPSNGAARLDLAQLLLERMPPSAAAAVLHEAADLLAAAGPAERTEARYRALETRLSMLRETATFAPVEQLLRRIDANPGDLAARFELARRYVAERAYPEALEQLLEVIVRDRRFGDDAPRRLMLSVFDLSAANAPLVASYRRRLSAALNR